MDTTTRAVLLLLALTAAAGLAGCETAPAPAGAERADEARDRDSSSGRRFPVRQPSR